MGVYLEEVGTEVLNSENQVGIVHHRITTFFVILNNFGLLFSRQRLVTVLSL